MSRRFIPPAVAIFAGGTDAALAAAVARAREEGFMEGRLHGLQEGHAAGRLEGETQMRETLQAELAALRGEYAKLDQQNVVSAALDRVLAARAADLAALDLATRTAIAAALRTLFPVLLACSQGMELEVLLQAALTERPDETLRLRAHPDTLAVVAGEVSGGPPDTTRVTLVADPSLAPGAAEIAWTGGGLTFDPANVLQQVVTLLGAVPPAPATPLLPPSSPEPAEEPPT
jgi:flagellar biosynthesis/type III secretory pathway protein FliH